MSLRCSLLALALALFACDESNPSTSDAASDAGSNAGTDARADAGSGAVDASTDSGSDAGNDDAGAADAGDAGTSLASVPRAVDVARTTSIPACTVFVDVANNGAADGTAAQPYRTIAEAIAALESDAVVCVAEGTYAEALDPGTKYFTLAGGFQSGQSFTVRDSAQYITRAEGDGTNTFFRSVDPGPTEGQLTVVDGFEITGYSQAIVRDIYYSQSFDITNNFIHDNACVALAFGGGFSLINTTGTVSGNVIARNTCSRGGAGAMIDGTNNANSGTITNNWIDSNVGDQPGESHGGGLYILINRATITANLFTGNSATGWGGGLYVGADPGQGVEATAAISWNIYRNNRAAVFGGGFFCDDGATCNSEHEIYENNCGANIFLDSSPDLTTPTIATFDHVTSHRGLSTDCTTPEAGVIFYKANPAPDSYAFTNSIFWGNAPDHDFNTSCDPGFCNATISVSSSDVQTTFMNNGMDINFGAGNLPGVDPLFVGADNGDFHLQSTRGHWTPSGFVEDAADSAALGDGSRSELGAYGDSIEASR